MLMSLLKRIRDKFFSSDRRRSDRILVPELAAYFWTGGTPLEHRIRDISATGLYLVTEDTWFPGTLMMITLQNKDAAEDDPQRAVVIQTRVVRRNEDGVGLVFIFVDAKDHRPSQNLLKGGADRRTLERFLKGFLSESGRAVVNSVVPPEE
jgi:c-di-GMP-binding flagellar brake protein YcgR